MKITFDFQTDTLTIRFKDVHVSKSDELREGIIADYDVEGILVGLEFLDASERISEPQNIIFESMGHPVVGKKGNL